MQVENQISSVVRDYICIIILISHYTDAWISLCIIYLCTTTIILYITTHHAHLLLPGLVVFPESSLG